MQTKQNKYMKGIGKVNNSKISKHAKGTLILLLGGIICKLLGAFYRIPLTNILGAEGMGIYQLIFPVYSLFLVFTSGGIPIALSKIVAECRAHKEYSKAKRYLWQSFLYLTIISFIFSLIFVIFAEQISAIQGNSLAKLGYVAIAGAIIFASMLTAFRGYFQGFQNMFPTVFSQIIEQVFKLGLGLFFAYILLQRGVEYAVLGAMLGIALSEILSLIYLFTTYFVKNRKINLGKKIDSNFLMDFKYLFKKTLPIAINAMISPLILAIDSFLIVNLLLRTGLDNSVSTQIFGVYSGMVNSLVSLPTIVSVALAISLVPTISYKSERGEDAGSLISSSLKMVFIIAIPAIFIFSFFPNEIMRVLYPSATTPDLLSLGASLLKISSINILYISLLQVSTAVLQAGNKGGISLINLLFAGGLKIILTIFFVLSPLNIYGAAVSSMLCFAFASGLNLIALKDNFNFLLEPKSFIGILISTFVMVGACVGINNVFLLFSNTTLSFIFSMLFGGIIYLVLIFTLPVFDEQDIARIPLGNKLSFLKRKTTSSKD